MLDPKVAKTQTKATERPAAKLVERHSILAARPWRGSPVEQVPMIQGSLSNHATLRLLAQRGQSASGPGGDHAQKTDFENMTAREAPCGCSWGFGEIPIFPPDREDQSQARPSLAALRLPAVIQSKLSVGKVDDPLEQEADRVADQVMRTPTPELFIVTTPLQFKHNRNKTIAPQTKSADTSGAAAGEAPGIAHEALLSPGQPLDKNTRAFFEPRFGHDLSRVRVHADADAAASARAIGALAYTIGPNLVFAKGQYAPNERAGRRLLAHELAHTIQQASIEKVASTSPHILAFNNALIQRQPDDTAQSAILGPSAVQGQKGPGTRYPPDPAAWNSPAGGIQLLPVVESELPATDFTPPAVDHIYAGVYKIVPQLKDRASPHVVYYIAYNTQAKRAEIAISPDQLDTFISHNFAFMVAAGNFFGFTGQPAKYEVTSAQMGYLFLKGDFRGALSALGRSWVQAFQNPNWWMQAIGATAGGLAAGPETVAGSEIESTAAAELQLPRAVGADVDISLTSKINQSSYAMKTAESLSEAAQRDVDSLLSQLKAGNANPGIGTRALGKGFFELRGRNAGRVIIKQTSASSFDIVGKFQGHVRGDAANAAVIERLIREYTP
jgi:hypothetical protein